MSELDPNRDHPQDDLAAYALDALPPGEAAALEDHLAGCDACRERLRWLAPAVDQIPAAIEQHAAPEAVRARLMAIVDAEADVPRRAASEAAPRERAARRWLPDFSGFSLRPALAGMAVVLLLVAGVAGYELHDTGGGADVRTYTAQAATGNATGALEVDGDAGTLQVTGMPAPPGDDVYQAWVKDAQGSVHPSSVFVTSKDGTGTVELPSGLDDAAEVLVTREPRGGSKLPTEDPLMTAQLS